MRLVRRERGREEEEVERRDWEGDWIVEDEILERGRGEEEDCVCAVDFDVDC